jgi:hypothetical protein
MGLETGIPLTYQLMDPLYKELSGLLLEPLHHLSLDVFIRPKTMAL